MPYDTVDRSDPAITGIERDDDEPTYREVELTLSSEAQALIFGYIEAKRKATDKPEDEELHMNVLRFGLNLSSRIVELFEAQFMTPEGE